MSEALRAELLGWFRRGVDAALSESAFDDLALRVFEHQIRTNSVYRRYAESAAGGIAAVQGWRGLPLVPARAFRAVRLLAPESATPSVVFRTSGTTGQGKRGAHHVLDLRLYHASLLPNFSAYVLPDEARPHLHSLLPSPQEAPDSSLAHMMGVVARELCAPDARFHVTPHAGLVVDELMSALTEADDATPILLAGTAFAFVHFLDGLAAAGRTLRLPSGSRAMVTGGYKGRSRALEPEALYRQIQEHLSIAPDRVVAEYGMTEMLSQFYDPVLRSGGADSGVFVGPPWVRTQVLDPVSLRPSPPNQPGLLAHVDLANLHSVSAILTEDLGIAEAGGFRLLGRATGSELRGCSLSFEAMVTAEAAARTGR